MTELSPLKVREMKIMLSVPRLAIILDNLGLEGKDAIIAYRVAILIIEEGLKIDPTTATIESAFEQAGQTLKMIREFIAMELENAKK